MLRFIPHFQVVRLLSFESVKFQLCFAEEHAHIAGGVSKILLVARRPKLREVSLILLFINIQLLLLIQSFSSHLIQVNLLHLLSNHGLCVLLLVVGGFVLMRVPKIPLDVRNGLILLIFILEPTLANNSLHLLERFELAVLSLAS